MAEKFLDSELVVKASEELQKAVACEIEAANAAEEDEKDKLKDLKKEKISENT